MFRQYTKQFISGQSWVTTYQTVHVWLKWLDIQYNTIDHKLSVVLAHIYWCPCRERQRARRRCCTRSV